MTPWWCARCGYGLLNGVEFGIHETWHRREDARAEYAEIDAEIEREFRQSRKGRELPARRPDTGSLRSFQAIGTSHPGVGAGRR